MDNFKLALRRLARSVAVITASDGDGVRYAMAATAVSEVSCDPPSMLVCVNRSASLYPILRAGAPFAINVLHRSHVAIAQCCAGVVKGEARFQQGDWHTSKAGPPRLADAQASLVCENVIQIDHGTHGIFIGNVLESYISGTPEPLIYVDGEFALAIHTKDARRNLTSALPDANSAAAI